jgi:protein-S-isoprenylcysteine O-methyltransferase Ste14
MLNTRRPTILVVGILVLLAGVVFALQGANVITGSSLMSGNSTYIYVGAVVAIIGLALVFWSPRVSKKASPVQTQVHQPTKRVRLRSHIDGRHRISRGTRREAVSLS